MRASCLLVSLVVGEEDASLLQTASVRHNILTLINGLQRNPSIEIKKYVSDAPAAEALIQRAAERSTSQTVAANFTALLQVLGPSVALRQRSNDMESDDGLDSVDDSAEVAARLQEAQRLSEEFVAAAAVPGLDDVTRKLLKSFRICGSCSRFVRLGEHRDGGYLTCMDRHKDIIGALSFGVEHHDQWSEDTQKLFGVKVGQFDCTVQFGSNCGGNCKFFKECIGSVDKHEGVHSSLLPMITLQQAIEEMHFDAAKKGTLVMKMDIEAAEWPIFEVEPVPVLKKFKQIIVEFHWLRKENQHSQMLQAMRTLRRAGFSVAHVHGNNFAGMYSVGKYQIPDVIEVTFVANAKRRRECTSWESLKDDAPNSYVPELPPAFLPKK